MVGSPEEDDPVLVLLADRYQGKFEYPKEQLSEGRCHADQSRESDEGQEGKGEYQ